MLQQHGCNLTQGLGIKVDQLVYRVGPLWDPNREHGFQLLELHEGVEWERDILEIVERGHGRDPCHYCQCLPQHNRRKVLNKFLPCVTKGLWSRESKLSR